MKHSKTKSNFLLFQFQTPPFQTEFWFYYNNSPTHRFVSEFQKKKKKCLYCFRDPSPTCFNNPKHI